MRVLVMANGDYGDPNWYQKRTGLFSKVICADGGAGTALRLGIRPDWVVGDMDSVRPEDRSRLEQAGVATAVYPREKDYTDLQLALELAVREGASEVVIWGGLGSRLDHTLSAIFSASALLEHNIRVRFEKPEVEVHLVADRLQMEGQVGETVSLIVLSEVATGVTLQGFRYPLLEATLSSRCQYAVSNLITGTSPVIAVKSGLLAVIHYRILPD